MQRSGTKRTLRNIHNMIQRARATQNGTHQITAITFAVVECMKVSKVSGII